MKTRQDYDKARRIGRNLKKERKRLRLTLNEVSEKVGCSYFTLIRLEKGSTPGSKWTKRVADYYGCKLEGLFEDDYVETEEVTRIMTPKQRKLVDITDEYGDDITQMCIEFINMMNRVMEVKNGREKDNEEN